MRSEGWAELYPWRLDRATGTPLFRQIYTQIRAAILSGALGAGAKLPSSRALASNLGIARASAVALTSNFSPRAISRPGEVRERLYPPMSWVGRRNRRAAPG
jgi:DNA-binding transcriptional MocR family regulator